MNTNMTVLDGLCICALDESSLSIRRVKDKKVGDLFVIILEARW